MASNDVLYKILDAIMFGGPELLEFANLAPEDSTLILDSLFDLKNRWEDQIRKDSSICMLSVS